jgi:lactate dehydrogenase-like 2-hydroxyacid dehydrogenase
MRICLLETQPSEEECFSNSLGGHAVSFVSALEDVGPDVEILSVYIHYAIGAKFLENRPALKLITTRSVGYDHLDVV